MKKSFKDYLEIISVDGLPSSPINLLVKYINDNNLTDKEMVSKIKNYFKEKEIQEIQSVGDFIELLKKCKTNCNKKLMEFLINLGV